MDLQQLLTWLIPDPEDCRRQAAELRLEDPDLSSAEVAHKAVQSARKWAATMGAVTGVAASPVTMLPAAVADAAAMLRIEGTMAGTIAALLDPASLDDPVAFRRDIVRVIFPAAVSQALRKIGVKVGEETAKSLIQKYAGRALMKEIGEQAAKRLGVRLTQKAIATKAVPIVGAGIGAAWNWLEIQAIGRRAIAYHLGYEVETPARGLRRKVTAWVKEKRDRRLLTDARPRGAAPAEVDAEGDNGKSRSGAD